MERDCPSSRRNVRISLRGFPGRVLLAGKIHCAYPIRDPLVASDCEMDGWTLDWVVEISWDASSRTCSVQRLGSVVLLPQASQLLHLSCTGVLLIEHLGRKCGKES